MPVIYECDGCQKRETGEVWPGGWFKPSHWFQRRDRDDEVDLFACSRGCIDAIAKARSCTAIVLPI